MLVGVYVACEHSWLFSPTAARQQKQHWAEEGKEPGWYQTSVLAPRVAQASVRYVGGRRSPCRAHKLTSHSPNGDFVGRARLRQVNLWQESVARPSGSHDRGWACAERPVVGDCDLQFCTVSQNVGRGCGRDIFTGPSSTAPSQL